MDYFSAWNSSPFNYQATIVANGDIFTLVRHDERSVRHECIAGSASDTENFNLAAHQQHANNSDRSPTSLKSRINLSATAEVCRDEKTNTNAERRVGGDPSNGQ